MFWTTQCYTRFWIKHFMIDVWHYDEYALDSEYARVLNMLSYTWFWIKLHIIDIWQGFKYVWSSEYASAAQGSLENDPSYMFDRVLRIPRIINMLGLEFTRVVNMIRLQRAQWKHYFKAFWISWVLNMLRFWIYQESKYGKVTKYYE